MNALTLRDARSFIDRQLIGKRAEEVFVSKWAGMWHFSLHSRRPGALLLGCYTNDVPAAYLLQDAMAAIDEHDARKAA